MLTRKRIKTYEIYQINLPPIAAGVDFFPFFFTSCQLWRSVFWHPWGSVPGDTPGWTPRCCLCPPAEQLWAAPWASPPRLTAARPAPAGRRPTILQKTRELRDWRCNESRFRTKNECSSYLLHCVCFRKIKSGSREACDSDDDVTGQTGDVPSAQWKSAGLQVLPLSLKKQVTLASQCLQTSSV